MWASSETREGLQKEQALPHLTNMADLGFLTPKLEENRLVGILCFYICDNLMYNYNLLVITIEMIICDNLLITARDKSL